MRSANARLWVRPRCSIPVVRRETNLRPRHSPRPTSPSAFTGRAPGWSRSGVRAARPPRPTPMRPIGGETSVATASHAAAAVPDARWDVFIIGVSQLLPAGVAYDGLGDLRWVGPPVAEGAHREPARDATRRRVGVRAHAGVGVE